MRNLLFFPILFLLLALSSQITVADVLIEDFRNNARTSFNGGFGDGIIATGDGEAGNYVIFNCAAPNDIGNVFNNPTPGSWNQLDQGACGNNGNLCRHGVWGGFVDNPASEDITCSWTEFGTVFSATSMRFTGADPFAPVGNIVCDSGTTQGNEFIAAPEVFASAGSQVLSIITFSTLTQGPTTTTNSDNPFITRNAQPSAFTGITADSSFQNVTSLEGSTIVPTDGTYSSLDVGLLVPVEWRACSIEIRMAAVERSVPTMSEWGLIGFATFAGIAGFWFLRRRQLTA